MEEIGFKNAAVMAEGVSMAGKFGRAIMDEATGNKQAILAAAIMLSTFIESSGATEEQMIDILKSVHQLTKEFSGKGCMQ
jgi:hypothetical protein